MITELIFIHFKHLINSCLLFKLLCICQHCFIQTDTYLIRWQWFLVSQIRHDHWGPIFPSVEVSLDLHDKVRVMDDLLRIVAHGLVRHLELVKKFLHFAVSSRLQCLKRVKAKAHMNLRILLHLLRGFFILSLILGTVAITFNIIRVQVKLSMLFLFNLGLLSYRTLLSLLRIA